MLIKDQIMLLGCVFIIFGHFKYEIAKVDCVAIGHLTKKDLPRGHWKHLTAQELNLLMMI